MSHPVESPNINAGRLIWKPPIPISFTQREVVIKRGAAKLRVSMLDDLKLLIRIGLDGLENFEFVVPNVHPKFVLRELRFEWAEDKLILGINGVNASSIPRAHQDHESTPLVVIATLPARAKELS